MNSEICKCGVLEIYVKDPSIPIKYNEKLNEYYISFGENGSGTLIMSYCPNCGEKLPESKRADNYMEIDEEFSKYYMKILEYANSIEDILEKLGEPDNVIQPPRPSEIDIEVYGMKEMKRQLDYTNLSETTVLSVADYADGSFDLCFFGKPKNENDA